ncbi:selenoprotein S isoform X1 [Parasteatoda tepidariorum]|uniref:selenoprotein S isoform X1 n=1 Tax=Parasteatoda tepidariorum TaxID=114398 RepID=UPI001C72519A|nr:selenoprotein S isoform X1 [Parasteatoda tepidariorum]XP_042906611.1 selenoprotein S isoform X1 [Parasteatoda tepidariorum]XP_042906612.1 selenoprotein S isoform X1 [Parasteatoda tepidariorum]XP_042906613.1 selenoprotein S isoform X1 [Parasteatoda tepidariorum]
MDIPVDEKPAIERNTFEIVTEFLSTYGWTCLFIVVVLNLIWSHFYPKYKKWQERQEDQRKEAEYKKDPTRLIEREEAMQLARRKLQEKHDQLAQEHAEKMRLKEEQKKKERIEAMENLMKGKSTKPKPKDESQSLRPEYNPLMGGSSSSSCFRPTRRGTSGGG